MIAELVGRVFAPMEDWLYEKEQQAAQLQAEVQESLVVLERARVALRE